MIQALDSHQILFKQRFSLPNSDSVAEKRMRDIVENSGEGLCIQCACSFRPLLWFGWDGMLIA